MKASISLFCLYLGFREEIADLTGGHYSTMILHERVRSLKDVHPSYTGTWENKSFVFVDYSRVDAGLAPPGKVFGVICTSDHISNWENLDESAYRQKKEKIARIMLEHLEKAMPGIGRRIEYMEAATARTIKRYTLNPDGAPYGFAQIPSQAGTRRPRSASPVKNLFLAGNWTFPGGGFTGAIISGVLAASNATRQLQKRQWPETTPDKVFSREVPLIRKREIAVNTLELTFHRPEDFSFVPGQYAHLVLKDHGDMALDMPVRTLSIASHPEEKVLRFIMRKSPSPFKVACTTMEKKEEVLIFGPEGDFFFDSSERDPVFLVAGIGISPVLSIIRELELSAFPGKVSLFYSNRNESEAAFHAELQKIGLPGWDYHPVFTSARARIGQADLAGLENMTARDYYIVGGSAFLASMKGLLAASQIPEGQIHSDDFG